MNVSRFARRHNSSSNPAPACLEEPFPGRIPRENTYPRGEHHEHQSARTSTCRGFCGRPPPTKPGLTNDRHCRFALRKRHCEHVGKTDSICSIVPAAGPWRATAATSPFLPHRENAQATAGRRARASTTDPVGAYHKCVPRMKSAARRVAPRQTGRLTPEKDSEQTGLQWPQWNSIRIEFSTPAYVDARHLAGHVAPQAPGTEMTPEWTGPAGENARRARIPEISREDERPGTASSVCAPCAMQLAIDRP